MRNRKTLSLLFITAALSVFIGDATAQAFTKYNFSGAAGGGSLNYKIAPDVTEIEGSPYYEDQWKPGVIYNHDNTYTEIPDLRYNLNSDELVFKHNGTQYIVPNRLKIKRFRLGEEEFVGGKLGDGYTFFKVVEPGESLMVVKHFDSKIEKGAPSKGYIPATKDKFVTKDELFVLKPGHDAMEINPRKGDKIVTYLSDRRGEIEGYIDSNKLKMRNLQDLVSVVKFYNSITTAN